MPRDVADLLEAALGLLYRDCPEAYERVAAELRDRPISFRIGASAFHLDFEAGRHRLCRNHEPTARTRVETDSPTLLALIDDEIGIVDALRTGRLELFGSPRDIAGFHEALTAFLAGAARTPAAPDLLNDLRNGA